MSQLNYLETLYHAYKAAHGIPVGKSSMLVPAQLPPTLVPAALQPAPEPNPAPAPVPFLLDHAPFKESA